jgi:replicative DNA helicase
MPGLKDRASGSADPALAALQSVPHSLEAEQSVLGALMLDNLTWDSISELITATDFYTPAHQIIFGTIASHAVDSKPFDPLMLAESLRETNQLEEAGGSVYLAKLIQSTPSISNILGYAGIISERSTLRKLITASRNIAERAYNPGGRPSTELLDEAEREVFQIAEARPKSGGPVAVRQLLQKTIDLIEARVQADGALTGLGTGFTDLDQMTFGLQAADLIIVAGRPSMGKTTFAMNLVENAVLNSDKAVLVFSLEMPADSLMMRSLSSIGRVEQNRIRAGNLDDDDWTRISAAMSQLSKGKLFIDDTPGISPGEIRSRVRRVVREHGEPALIMVDYLQLMRVPGASESRTQEISEISRMLKSIAREFNVPVVALSQLNRGLEQRPNKRPINSDLRESGAIEQDADVIMFVYREEVYNPDTEHKGIAEIIIGKQRNGPIGTARLAFQGKFTRFDNLAAEAYAAYEGLDG